MEKMSLVPSHTPTAPSARPAAPSLHELNTMLDHVRNLETQLASSIEHMNAALKKMMKHGQWRKEWNRLLNCKDLSQMPQLRSLQVDLLSKLQSVRQEMSSKVQENEFMLLDAQQALIGKRERYILELQQQLATRPTLPLETLVITGTGYTSNELETFLWEQKTQLELEVKSFRTRRDSPRAPLSSKGFLKCMHQEIGFVAKSLSNLLQSRKTRAELLDNAILCDYSYETPEGYLTSSSPSSASFGQPNNGLNVILGMTTEELQLLTQFHAFSRTLAKENLVLKWKDLEREDKLGEGAYSVVEQGWCQGRLVAIKLFKTTRNSAIQAFMREVNALRACQENTKTVKLIGVCVESRERLCIVTPLYKGGSIHDALYKHGHVFSREQALMIARDLAEGVAQIHSAGFIHRDITPTNILLHPDRNGKSFIADFGISIPISETCLNGAMGVAKSPRGHPRYKAPEIVSRDPYDEKIDIWQCGTVLYVLFSGKRPFEGMADREVSSKMSRGSLPDSFPNIPLPIIDIITQCWYLDPTQRPSAKQLSSMLSNLSVSALSAPSSTSQSPRDIGKKKDRKIAKSHSVGEVDNRVDRRLVEALRD